MLMKLACFGAEKRVKLNAIVLISMVYLLRIPPDFGVFAI